MGVVLGNRTDDCFDTYMKNTFSIYCAEEYLQKELAFVDLDTIEKDLVEERQLSANSMGRHLAGAGAG